MIYAKIKEKTLLQIKTCDVTWNYNKWQKLKPKRYAQPPNNKNKSKSAQKQQQTNKKHQNKYSFIYFWDHIQ